MKNIFPSLTSAFDLKNKLVKMQRTQPLYSFIAIIGRRREVGYVLTSNNINHTNFLDYIWDEIEKCWI